MGDHWDVDYSRKPWPPARLACMLACGCIPGGAPPSRRCNGRWTRCPERMAAIRAWQDQQPDKAEDEKPLTRAQREVLLLLDESPRLKGNATGFGRVGGSTAALLADRGLADYDSEGEVVYITAKGRELLTRLGDPGDGGRRG